LEVFVGMVESIICFAQMRDESALNNMLLLTVIAHDKMNPNLLQHVLMIPNRADVEAGKEYSQEDYDTEIDIRIARFMFCAQNMAHMMTNVHLLAEAAICRLSADDRDRINAKLDALQDGRAQVQDRINAGEDVREVIRTMPNVEAMAKTILDINNLFGDRRLPDGDIPQE
jgi:hypothetical protein